MNERSALGNNIDNQTVSGFGDEWKRFQHQDSEIPSGDIEDIFHGYFSIFPWQNLPKDARGLDAGCGSGRWAELVAPRVGYLHCVDASADALAVARKKLSALPNVSFHYASIDAMPLDDGSMDFGYSLGVLHHMPRPADGLAACVSKLKRGAPFLLYIYYAFDNRPLWFRMIWRITDFARRGISRLPFKLRAAVAETIAILIYFPIARLAKFIEKVGFSVDGWPLSAYRARPFYVMRTDALDRFGTRLEQRMTRDEIASMMRDAGLEDIRFSAKVPYWCAVGLKR